MKNTADNNRRFAGALGGDKYALLQRSIPYYLALQRVIASAARAGLPRKVEESRFVLDLGCGTGITTLACGQILYDVAILGVDNEPAMLRQYIGMMRKHTSELQARGVVVNSPIRQDALEFLKDFVDSSIDVVVSGFMLHNLPKALRRKIVMQIGRVLRPNGRFVNADKIARDNVKLHERDLMRQIAKFVECWSSPTETAYWLGWIEHYMRDNQPDLKQTESEVRKTLREAGFGRVRITERHGLDAVVIADRLAR